MKIRVLKSKNFVQFSNDRIEIGFTSKKVYNVVDLKATTINYIDWWDFFSRWCTFFRSPFLFIQKIF